MKFEALGLSEPILRAVTAEGYTKPTPIQVQAIPHILRGRDVLGCAQTGTGKTAAFALPILHRLHHASTHHRRHRSIRVLVLSPTRELASQIGESFRSYGRHTDLRSVVIYGGVNQSRQTNALQAGTDILVATPGRLLDLMRQGHVDLHAVAVFVLDEADRMLDMGFIHDIRKIVAHVPKTRQTLFFSATMPPDIRRLADSILHSPVSVQVAPASAAADNVEQSVYHVKKKAKPVLLAHLLRDARFRRSLVFARTKSGANRVVCDLERVGIASEAIHGNKSQRARERAIENFKTGRTLVLVATDLAARGLDIDDISHVINFDLPNVPETYVHRIGRTARAGASGVAVSFCDPAERSLLKSIERLIRRPIAVKQEQLEYPAVPDTHDGSDRPQHSPICQPRQQKPPQAHPRSHSVGSSHQAPAARRDGAASGKLGTRRGRSNRRRGTSQHTRQAQHSHPETRNDRRTAPQADAGHSHAEPTRDNAHPTAKPTEVPLGVGHRLRGRHRHRPGQRRGPRR